MSRTVSGLVSVVLVNFRGADDTIVALDQLSDVAWPAEKLEAIVVENGSGDDSAARLQAYAASSTGLTVKVIVSDENLGFTGGSNLGAKSARGQFLAFLNNDAKPSAGWIREAIKQFDLGPQVAAVGSKVLDWDGKRVDFVGGSLTWFGMGHKDKIGQLDNPADDKARDILFGTGSALFVRADVFDAVGGFDERLFMFYDDVDLGWRLNLLGYRVRYAPDSIVFHKHHGSMRSFGAYRESYLLERNALMMLYKNIGEDNLAKFLPAALALVARRATAKSGVSPTSFDIREFTGASDEFDETIPVNKEAAAGLFAIDQFVAALPSLTETRGILQSARTRTDTDLFGLFGDMFHPLFHDPYFLEGYESLVENFAIEAPTRRNRILIVTGDAIGAKMAGPALRAWKMSEMLSRENDVHLVSWNGASRSSDAFEVDLVRLQNEREMRVHEEWADVIIIQGYALHHFKTLRKTQKILVCDLYDPMHLEQLEQGREFGSERWGHQVASATEVLNEQLIRGDFFLCASERQRMFWLGQLAAVGRINPLNYAADENLDSLIAIAPFGVDSAPPVKTRKAIRGVVPGISDTDKIVIWGGGIYNWFDPLTLIAAIGRVAETHPDIKLFFLGVKHPNPDVPEMAIVAKCRELADRLGLAGRNVFFNESWVALDDRQNYLLEADAGVSTHYDHVETQFSFRTRILDYLWAGLPIVTTDGDSFGDLVASDNLGVAVTERDVQGLADALEKTLYDDEFAAVARANVKVIAEQFTWEKTLAPLVEFARDPHIAADRFGTEESDTPEFTKSGKKSGSKRKQSSEERFHAIAQSRRGVARDLMLARYYLTEGGVAMLRTKVRDRLDASRPAE